MKRPLARRCHGGRVSCLPGVSRHEVFTEQLTEGSKRFRSGFGPPDDGPETDYERRGGHDNALCEQGASRSNAKIPPRLDSGIRHVSVEQDFPWGGAGDGVPLDVPVLGGGPAHDGLVEGREDQRVGKSSSKSEDDQSGGPVHENGNDTGAGRAILSRETDGSADRWGRVPLGFGVEDTESVR